MSPRLRKWSLIGVALLGIFFLWLGVRALLPDAQVERVRELRDELFSESGKNLPAEERKEKFKTFRESVDQLTPEQRKAAFGDLRKKGEAEMERYFTLSAAEKTSYLDQQIDRMESFKKKGPGGSFGKGAGGFGGGSGVGQTFSSPPSAQGPGKNVASTEEGRKRRLDQSTPEQRARRDQFFKDLQQRRQQRGLPPMSFGR